MVAIASVSPPRGRAGDTVTITGTGFVPGQQTVQFDRTTAVIVSESSTVVVVTVPAVTNTDAVVELVIKATDGSNLFDFAPWWSKATMASLQTARIPGQVPGSGESLTAEQPDAAEAKDYERLATIVEFLRGVLTTKGDLYARTSSALTRFGVGADGRALQADPAATEGLKWAAPDSKVVLPWGRQVQAAEATMLGLVANGDASLTPTNRGRHVAPVNGQVDLLWALVEEEGSSDTLDRVRLTLNGATAYDSGAGLGLTDGQSHRAAPAVNVVQGDVLILLVQKSGTAAAMRVIGGVRIHEDPFSVLLRDTLSVTDAVEAVGDTFVRSAGGDSITIDEAPIIKGHTYDAEMLYPFAFDEDRIGFFADGIEDEIIEAWVATFERNVSDAIGGTTDAVATDFNEIVVLIDDDADPFGTPLDITDSDPIPDAQVECWSQPVIDDTWDGNVEMFDDVAADLL